MGNREGEYFQRMLRLRGPILSNPDIFRNVRSVFRCHSEGSLRSERALRDGILFLGGGDSHAVYNVGIVQDPLDGRDVHVAMRTNNTYPYDSRSYHSRGNVAAQIEAYDFVFKNKKEWKVPYFCGAVAWNNHLGILTEDISERKRWQLEEAGYEHIKRKGPHGTEELFFIDPIVRGSDYWFGNSKYLEEGAVIDFPRLGIRYLVWEMLQHANTHGGL